MQKVLKMLFYSEPGVEQFNRIYVFEMLKRYEKNKRKKWKK